MTIYFLDADPARESINKEVTFHIRECERNADLLKAMVLLYIYL